MEGRDAGRRRSRRFAARGADVKVWPRSRIIHPERIRIGDSVIIDDFALLMAGAGIDIGSFVHIAAFSSVMGGGELSLGDFSCLSGGVRVYTGNDDYLGGSLTNPTVPGRWRVPERSHVHVGRHVVIGANSVVLPGISIGEGAVVGACSFVKHDLEPWTVNVGAPARPIRERPRDRILALEQDLRRTLYDSRGRYIPRSRRRGDTA